LKSGDWPFAQPLSFLVADRRLPREMRDFLRWVTGPEAANVMRRLGFADTEPEAVPLARQGDRLAHALERATGRGAASLEDVQSLVTVLRDASRLSTTIRFAPGQTRPDPSSQAAVMRLARALEAGLYDDHDVLVVGFSDGQGPAGANRDISRRRAAAVRDRILEAAPLVDRGRVSFETLGFGEALPMACDDTDKGRRVNRRVEIWVRPHNP